MSIFNRKVKKPCGCWSKTTAFSVVEIFRCPAHYEEWVKIRTKTTG